MQIRIISLLLLCGAFCARADARTLQAHIGEVATAIATLRQVDVRLHWPSNATQGQLTMRAALVEAPDLGYRFSDLVWTCPLRRANHNGWQCDGAVRSGAAKPLRLSLRFDDAMTDAALSRNAARFALHRNAASPDSTGLTLAKVPVAWAQALAAQAWANGHFKSGTLDGRLQVAAPSDKPLRVSGELAFAGLGLETPDAGLAAEKLGGRFSIDYRKLPIASMVTLDGQLRGGEFLAGNTYVALPDAPVDVRVDGMARAGEGWRLPHLAWSDGAALGAEGNASFTAQGALNSLDIRARSRNLRDLRDRYLSGWLGVLGLADVDLRGGIDLNIAMANGKLANAAAELHDVVMLDPKHRFSFDGLDGAIRFSANAPVASMLRWRSSRLYGLELGAAQLPMTSRAGRLAFDRDVRVPAMGGTLTLQNLSLRPPANETGMEIRFGLALDDIDFGKISDALGLPAFRGRLTGRIPNAHYANQRLEFDGGLSMALFGGAVRLSSLSMERPFGVAPSVSADIAFNNLDLLSLTEVFDFGSITGRLDGEIQGLRLVDWTPVAFNADLRTDASQRVRQRISQRAVQNISSVGDASFVTSLQGQLIGLFDDFGYRRIRIGCKLENEICRMHGLSDTPHSEASGFTIVQGAGLPGLTVVGYNRQVDWPTLVERLAAVSKGDAKPVVQ